MPVVLFISAVLIGPQVNPLPDFWRSEFQSVMQASAERNHPRPEVAVPRLIHFYNTVEAIDALPQHERTRMRRSLESRLVRQLEDLVRRKKREDHMTQRKVAESSRPTLQGGGTSFAAQALIEVIVTTIAPDSWQQRGGPGSISYYPQNPALVIRQSQSVHEQIADLLRALQ